MADCRPARYRDKNQQNDQNAQSLHADVSRQSYLTLRYLISADGGSTQSSSIDALDIFRPLSSSPMCIDAICKRPGRLTSNSISRRLDAKCQPSARVPFHLSTGIISKWKIIYNNMHSIAWRIILHYFEQHIMNLKTLWRLCFLRHTQNVIRKIESFFKLSITCWNLSDLLRRICAVLSLCFASGNDFGGEGGLVHPLLRRFRLTYDAAKHGPDPSLCGIDFETKTWNAFDHFKASLMTNLHICNV